MQVLAMAAEAVEAADQAQTMADVLLPALERSLQVRDILDREWDFPPHFPIHDDMITRYLEQYNTVERAVEEIARFYQLPRRSSTALRGSSLSSMQSRVPAVREILARGWESNGTQVSDDDILRCWRGNSLGTAEYIAHHLRLRQRLPCQPSFGGMPLPIGSGLLSFNDRDREINGVRDEIYAHWDDDHNALGDNIILKYLRDSIFSGRHAIDDAAYRIAHDFAFRQGLNFHLASTKRADRDHMASKIHHIMRSGYDNPDNLEISTPLVIRAVQDHVDRLGLERAVDDFVTGLGLRRRVNLRRTHRGSRVNENGSPTAPVIHSRTRPAGIRKSPRSLPRHRASRPTTRSRGETPQLPSTSPPNNSNQENITPSEARVYASDDVMSVPADSDNQRSPTPPPPPHQPPNNNRVRPFRPAEKGHSAGRCHPCPMYPGQYHHQCEVDECHGVATFVAVVDDVSRFFLFDYDRDILGRGGYGGMQPDLEEMRRFLERHDRANREREQEEDAEEDQAGDDGGNGGSNDEDGDSGDGDDGEDGDEDASPGNSQGGAAVNPTSVVRRVLGDITLQSTAKSGKQQQQQQQQKQKTPPAAAKSRADQVRPDSESLPDYESPSNHSSPAVRARPSQATAPAPAPAQQKTSPPKAPSNRDVVASSQSPGELAAAASSKKTAATKGKRNRTPAAPVSTDLKRVTRSMTKRRETTEEQE